MCTGSAAPAAPGAPGPASASSSPTRPTRCAGWPATSASPRVRRRRGRTRGQRTGGSDPRQAHHVTVPPPQADEVKVTAATAARRDGPATAVAWRSAASTASRCRSPRAGRAAPRATSASPAVAQRAAEAAPAASAGRVQHRRPRQGAARRPDRVRGATHPDPHRQHDRQGLPHQRLGGRRRAQAADMGESPPPCRPRPRNGPPRNREPG